MTKSSAQNDRMSEVEACFVIPTFNRVDALQHCLEHLERQTFKGFETIVVDDGSTDATARFMEQYLASTALRLRYVRQQNSGPARARNRAAAMTEAPVCIIIGDDILCSPDFAAVHVGFHRKRPEANVAGLGLTRWNESLQVVTPFMRWMDSSGTQFAYRELLRGEKPDWRHFYTSNISVKTELLRANPFDERFSKACMEDSELGYRLQMQRKLEIVLLQDATAEHLHPTDFRRACKRAAGVGAAYRLFDSIWPGVLVSRHGRFTKGVLDLLCRNPWMLMPTTIAVDALTRVWCPNPMIRLTLAYHVAVARREAAE